MKRKFAFLLAGCLILSPISAGMISDPALAAETESSADKVPSEFSVTAVIRDGSDTVLDTEQEYNMNLDESFQIIAQFDQDSASSIPSPVFSSDALRSGDMIPGDREEQPPVSQEIAFFIRGELHLLWRD